MIDAKAEYFRLFEWTLSLPQSIFESKIINWLSKHHYLKVYTKAYWFRHRLKMIFDIKYFMFHKNKLYELKRICFWLLRFLDIFLLSNSKRIESHRKHLFSFNHSHNLNYYIFFNWMFKKLFQLFYWNYSIKFIE